MSLGQAKKTLVALVGFVALLLANLFGIDIEPLQKVGLDLVDAVIGGATIYGVYKARNHRTLDQRLDDAAEAHQRETGTAVPRHLPGWEK